MANAATTQLAEVEATELGLGPGSRSERSTLIAEAEPEQQGRPRLASGPARYGRVLVVEDYPDLREVLVEVLEASGFDVTAIGSARDARAVEAQAVDVLLVGVNGYQREHDDDLALLQRDWRWTGVPIIVMATGDGGLRVPGVAHVLNKPVGVDALCAAIRAHLCPPAQMDG